MRHLPYKVTTKKLYLPEELVARVDLRLPQDPHGKKPAYAAWSRLVESLLREWIENPEIARPAAEPQTDSLMDHFKEDRPNV